MKKDMLELLIQSLDVPLSAHEQQQLETALQQSAALRAEQARLIKLRTALRDSQPEASPVFVDNLIAKLAKPKQPTLTAVMLSMYPQIAAACLIFMAVALSLIYASEGSLHLDAVVGLGDLSVSEAQTLVDVEF